MLWSIDSCQNKVSADQYRWPYCGLRCPPIEVEYFFEVIRWQVTSFQMVAGSSLLFTKFIWNMLCSCHYGPALLRFWFQTNLGRENWASYFRNTGGEDLFLPRSHVGHALRPIFMLWLVKIWQVGSCGKFMQHLDSWSFVTLTAEADRVLCQLLMFLTVFSTGCAKWNSATIKSLLLFMASLFIDFFGWEMRRLSKSEIRFRMAWFSFFTLLDR